MKKEIVRKDMGIVNVKQVQIHTTTSSTKSNSYLLKEKDLTSSKGDSKDIVEHLAS